MTSQGSEVHKFAERWHGGKVKIYNVTAEEKKLNHGKLNFLQGKQFLVYQPEKNETKLQKRLKKETVTSLLSIFVYKRLHLHNNGLAVLSHFTHTNE